MAYSVNGTGPYSYSSTGLPTQTSIVSYSFFSNLLPTTDSFEDNIFDFGTSLGHIEIVNTGANPNAFQWPDKYITTNPPTPANTACGIVPPAVGGVYGVVVIPYKANKKGMKVRSANTGSQSTFYIWGI